MTSPATSVSPATTAAFAASTRPRRGVAVSVRRIIPELYSFVTAVAPSTAKTIVLNRLPNRPMPTGSWPARSAALAPSQVAPTTSASSPVRPTDSRKASASLYAVPRSEDSFVHSERSVSAKALMPRPPAGSRRCRG